ncbi:MAG: hypothetical protein GY769_17780 [bacterium]|nr:hypothetical protein [bacterium]
MDLDISWPLRAWGCWRPSPPGPPTTPVLMDPSAAIEVPVDGRLDTTTQMTLGGPETLRIDTQVVIKVMSQGPVEDSALGVAGAIDPGLDVAADDSTLKSKDGTGSQELAVEPRRQGWQRSR